MYFVGSRKGFLKQQKICYPSLLIGLHAHVLRFAFVRDVLSALFTLAILVYAILMVLF